MHEIRDGTTKESPFRIDVDAFHGDKMLAPETRRRKKEERYARTERFSATTPFHPSYLSLSSLPTIERPAMVVFYDGRVIRLLATIRRTIFGQI